MAKISAGARCASTKPSLVKNAVADTAAVVVEIAVVAAAVAAMIVVAVAAVIGDQTS